MAAGVGADPYRGGDSHFLCSVLQHPSNCLIREGLACFAEEKVSVAGGAFFPVTIPERTVFDELLGQCRRFRHHTLLAALAMLHQNVIRFDVLRLHQDHLVTAHSCVKQQHDDGLVPHLQKVLTQRYLLGIKDKDIVNRGTQTSPLMNL